MVRIAEPKYYGDDAVRRDQAMERIAAHGCRFLVFGRIRDGAFETLDDLALPNGLRKLCVAVPAEDFRLDISSTAIRASESDTSAAPH